MTPKYYIGQKVIEKDGEKWRTVADIEYCETELVAYDDKPEYGYCYTLDNGETAFWYELTRPPAKLEFGYCAVGDTVEDCDNEWVTIEAVEKNMFAYSWFGDIKWILYEEADDKGWEIKEEKSLGYDQQEALENIYDPETITLNGKTYKLVE